MVESLWSGKKSREIITRIVVEGDLVLQTPAHLGNGDGDPITDMPLLIDLYEGRPLLTGASITGALRSYLREREEGYSKYAKITSDSVLLFGGVKGDDDGKQSALIIDDSLGEESGIEMRDGVKINSESRTAQKNALFNMQLWQAGTRFPLRFELLIYNKDEKQETQKNADRLKRALATALQGFNDGSIALGARKRRGYGRVKVNGWLVRTYSLTKLDDLVSWIEYGDKQLVRVPHEVEIKKVGDVQGWLTVLGCQGLIDDRRRWFRIRADFALDGSLLIRSGSGKDDQGPDTAHLHARQADESVGPKPILSGTSLGGVLRARTLKIANTIGIPQKARDLIDEMFGIEMKGKVTPKASRVVTEEHLIENVVADLVQPRIRVDRFTGGAFETALFSEQPVLGDGQEKAICISLMLREPQDFEIGLLLLVLKDLWTGDLPLGGESSVGRGRLKGHTAELEYYDSGTTKTWTITENENRLTISGDDRTELESSVKKLHSYLK